MDIIKDRSTFRLQSISNMLGPGRNTLMLIQQKSMQCTLQDMTNNNCLRSDVEHYWGPLNYQAVGSGRKPMVVSSNSPKSNEEVVAISLDKPTTCPSFRCSSSLQKHEHAQLNLRTECDDLHQIVRVRCTTYNMVACDPAIMYENTEWFQDQDFPRTNSGVTCMSERTLMYNMHDQEIQKKNPRLTVYAQAPLRYPGIVH